MANKNKKIGKIDFAKSIKNTMISGATGAAVSVLTQAVLKDDTTTQNIGLAVLGAVLPEIIKRPEAEVASSAMIGIASFRFAEENDLAGKLGISGIDDSKVIGKQPWQPTKDVFTRKTTATNKVSGSKEDDAVR